jgi:hypothetical protein
MPMETNPTALPTNIQPVRRTPETSTTTGVARRGDDSASPFAPQTNVSLKNSVANMAEVLSKIAAQQEDGVELMPQQIQKLVQNILKQSFSLQTTLLEGLGSTVESQRFSMEQLTGLARMLSQLGTMSERGTTTNLSDEMSALLQNFKALLTESHASLEPVLLHKMAFQLLDTRSLTDLPADLQRLLTSNAFTAASFARNGQENGLYFLQQLLRCFLPANGSDETAEPLGKMPAQSADTTAKSMGAEDQNTSSTTTAMQKQGTKESTPELSARTTNDRLTEPESGLRDAARSTADSPKTAAAEIPVPGKTTLPPAAEPQTLTTQPETAQQNGGKDTATQLPAEPNSTSLPTKGNESSLPTAKAPAETILPNKPGLPGTPAAQQMPTVLPNTPQMMDTMKNLATLLLKDAAMSPQDQVLLQNFINGKQTVLPEKDAKQLQLLLRLCQKNIPAAVQQASHRQIENLPKLWAFMQLCDLASIKEQNAQTLKTASKNIADFAATMKSTMEGEPTQTVDGQRSMNFMLPIYLGKNGQQQSYPAYLHIYDDDQRKANTGEPGKRETWLRLCLLTENIGAVELTCRIYETHKLNVRLFFSQPEAVQGFQEYIPEFKASFQDSVLELTDLKVGVAGAALS